MNCMKCGREIEVGQCFCAECLSEMEKYPVKPGTIVQLPQRTRQPQPKKPASRRRIPSPQEQVKRLKRLLHVLTVLLVLLLGMLGGILYMAFQQVQEAEDEKLPGQNYSVAETTEPTGTDDTQ